MTRLLALAAALAGAAALAAGGAIAQNVKGAIKARQGEMQLIAANVGVLGDMAKGKIAYDPAMAGRAAADLVAISTLNKDLIWLPDTDNGFADGTRALPAIWEKPDEFAAKWVEFGAAVHGVAKVAASGQEALAAAMGQLGGACKSCHESFRAEN